jgi:hypothetical protein
MHPRLEIEPKEDDFVWIGRKNPIFFFTIPETRYSIAIDSTTIYG